jgi:hypothetical protein
MLCVFDDLDILARAKIRVRIQGDLCLFYQMSRIMGKLQIIDCHRNASKIELIDIVMRVGSRQPLRV